jgi:hypothetical protein
MLDLFYHLQRFLWGDCRDFLLLHSMHNRVSTIDIMSSLGSITFTTSKSPLPALM